MRVRVMAIWLLDVSSNAMSNNIISALRPFSPPSRNIYSDSDVCNANQTFIFCKYLHLNID